MPRLASVLAIGLVALMAAGGASGENPHGKPAKQRGGAQVRVEVRFEDQQRSVVQGWYAQEIEAGHCPPGLAKKRNGCLPPGQAKKAWAIGRPLPREVIFHDLPPALAVEIGLPPAGYRFVRVANDILMIAVGTGMVIDAITDLGRI
jgi:hypothetical protein